MINLLPLVLRGIGVVNPNTPISIRLFLSQTNLTGVITPTYAAPVTSKASVSLEDTQRLTHINHYDSTRIYKRFYVPMIINGLNRPINKGGDLITTLNDNLVYKIVEVLEQFSSQNYTCVIGVCQ
jgi:hypothetical protein